MGNKHFSGSADRNAIILSDIFPLSDILFSTQLSNEADSVRVVVVEGSEEYLRLLERNAKPLTQASWRFGDPLMHGDTELRIFREGAFSTEQTIELLAFTLRHHLSELCKLILSDRSRLTVRMHGIKKYEKTFDFKPAGESGLIRVGSTDQALLTHKHKN